MFPKPPTTKNKKKLAQSNRWKTDPGKTVAGRPVMSFA
jgi:hypothetical protein